MMNFTFLMLKRITYWINNNQNIARFSPIFRDQGNSYRHLAIGRINVHANSQVVDSACVRVTKHWCRFYINIVSQRPISCINKLHGLYFFLHASARTRSDSLLLTLAYSNNHTLGSIVNMTVLRYFWKKKETGCYYFLVYCRVLLIWLNT